MEEIKSSRVGSCRVNGSCLVRSIIDAIQASSGRLANWTFGQRAHRDFIHPSFSRYSSLSPKQQFFISNSIPYPLFGSYTLAVKERRVKASGSLLSSPTFWVDFLLHELDIFLMTGCLIQSFRFHDANALAANFKEECFDFCFSE